DLVDALVWMVREVFPFNQALPGQCHNSLLDPAAVADRLLPAHREALQALADDPDPHPEQGNAFSGRSFRMINLVVDVPVTLPPDVQPPDARVELGRVVYVTAEFQLVDEATAQANEGGENAHALYKRRQHERVRRRLTRGVHEG